MSEISGPKSDELSLNLNPQLSFWKMCLARCRISTMSSCPSYRDWATPLRRDCLRRRRSGRRTRDRGSLSWPTAKVATGQYQYAHGDHSNIVMNLEGAAAMWQKPATDSFRSLGLNRKGETGLDQQARFWPTPKARDFRSGEQYAERDSPDLNVIVSRFGRQAPRSGIGGPPSSADGPNSRLNPLFVEWLMGFPIGWTALKPLATPSSPPAPPSRGVPSGSG